MGLQTEDSRGTEAGTKAIVRRSRAQSRGVPEPRRASRTSWLASAGASGEEQGRHSSSQGLNLGLGWLGLVITPRRTRDDGPRDDGFPRGISCAVDGSVESVGREMLAGDFGRRADVDAMRCCYATVTGGP